MSTTKFVIVTPGRVAFTSPKANKKFTSKPTPVVWNAYLQELLAVHGDIQVVTPGLTAVAPVPQQVAPPPGAPGHVAAPASAAALGAAAVRHA